VETPPLLRGRLRAAGGAVHRTPGYFDVLDIPVRVGRAFGATDDGEAPPVAVVSEGLARTLWPGESAVGRRLRVGGDSIWRTVVGVVGETQQPVESTPLPELYVPFAQDPTPLLFVLARVAGDPRGMAGTLQRAVARVDDGLGLANVTPLGDLTDRATSQYRALATVLSLFGLLALGLAMLGLYASLAYVVAQRRREIAIRVAVGANAWAIRGLVARGRRAARSGRVGDRRGAEPRADATACLAALRRHADGSRDVRLDRNAARRVGAARRARAAASGRARRAGGDHAQRVKSGSG
jgi:hypothetical protein